MLLPLVHEKLEEIRQTCAGMEYLKKPTLRLPVLMMSDGMGSDLLSTE